MQEQEPPNLEVFGKNQAVAIGAHSTAIVNSYLLPSPEPISLQLLSAPAPPTYFAGREKTVGDIISAIESGNNVAVTALHGMGGIGKTATAQYVAAKLAKQFPGGVLWAPLSIYEQNITPILREWIRICGHALSDESDKNVLANIARTLLHDRAKKHGPLLVIVDDARAAWMEATKVLVSSLPPNTSLLLTTRDEHVAVGLDAAVFRLEGLDTDDAFSLLNYHTKGSINTNLEDVATGRLLDVLGNLPLALELAGRYLRIFGNKPGFSFESFVDQVARKATEVLSLEGHKGLAATFQVTYDALVPLNQRLFRWLSVFAPGPIAPEHVAGFWRENLKSVTHSLNIMVAQALLSLAPDSRRYICHPLLRQYGETLLTATDEVSKATLAHARYFLNLYSSGSTSRSGVTVADDIMVSNLVSAATHALELGKLDELRSFGKQFRNWIYLLQSNGYYNEVTTVAEVVAKACSEANDWQGVTTAYSNLGAIEKDAGNYARAELYYQRALEQNVLHNSFTGQSREYFNLSMISSLLGDYVRADEYLALSAKTDPAVSTSARKVQMSAGQGISKVHRGEYAAAIPHLEEALKLYIQNNDERNSAVIYQNLASARTKLGLLPEARADFEKALSIYRHLKSPAEELSILAQLSKFCGEAGWKEDAKSFYDEALFRLSQLTGNVLQLSILNRLKEAATLNADKKTIRHIIELKTRLYRVWNDLGNEAKAFADLAHLAYEMGNFEVSEKEYLKSIKFYTELGQIDNQVWVLDNLGAVACAAEDHEKAKAYYSKILELTSEGNNYLQQRGQALEHLAHVAKESHDFGAMREHFELAFQLYSHARLRQSKARLLLKLAELNISERAFEVAHQEVEEALRDFQIAKDESGKAEALTLLGDIALAQGYYSNACKLFEQSLIILSELDKNIQRVQLQIKHASALAACSERKRALDSLQVAEVGAKQIEELRRGHLLEDISEIYAKLGHFHTAENLLLRSLGIFESRQRHTCIIHVLYHLSTLEGQGLDLVKARTYCQRALDLIKDPKNSYYVPLLRQLGRIAMLENDSDLAMVKLEHARRLCEELNDKETLADTYMNLAQLYHKKGQIKESSEIVESAILIFDQLKLQNQAVNSRLILGNLYLGLGQHDAAKECFERALKFSNNMGNLSLQAEALRHMGRFADITGDEGLSVRVYRQALRIFENIGNVDALAHLQVEYAVLEARRNHPQIALRMLKQALRYYVDTGNHKAQVRVWNNIAAIHKKAQEFVEAIRYSKQALIVAEQENRTQEVIKLLLRLSELEEDQGDYNAAILYAQRVFLIYEAMGDVENKASVVLRLGTLLKEEGHTALAHTHFSHIYEWAKRNKSIVLQALSAHYLCRNAVDNYQLVPALRYYMRAIRLCTKADLATNVVLCHGSLGSLLYNFGFYRFAERVFHRAHAACSNITFEESDTLPARIAFEQARVAIELKKYEEANEKLVIAKEMFTGAGAQSWILHIREQRGKLKLKSGDLKSAYVELNAALKGFERRKSVYCQGHCHKHMGMLMYSKKLYYLAARHYNLAMSIALKRGNFPEQANLVVLMITNYTNVTEPEKAELILRQIKDTSRQIGLQRYGIFWRILFVLQVIGRSFARTLNSS